MFRINAAFDPVTGVAIAGALDTTLQRLFAETVPDTAPADR